MSACGCGGEWSEVAVDRRLRCKSCGKEEVRREPADTAGGARESGGVSARSSGRRAVGSAEASVGLETPPPISQDGTPRPWLVGGAASDHEATKVGCRTTASVRFLPAGGFREGTAQMAIGTGLGGFTILELLGEGGMGIVYRARDEALARDVALKVISSSLCENRGFVERFRREARAAAALNHANITTIYVIGEDKGAHFYAMELVRGKSLIQVLEERGPLAPLTAAQLIRQAAEGLREAASKKIIHRDVKPSNLLLAESGVVKITDFGLAKALMGAVDETATGVVMGTPIYMSPEQGTGRPVDLRSDIYSLGVTLYQLVFARPPFIADSAISLMVKHLQEEPEFPADDRGAKPAGLVAVIRKMLEKDPARRYATYEALVSDLTAFIEGRPVLAAREQSRPAPDGAIVLRRKVRRDDAPASPGGSTMSRSRISIARASLKMARTDRAVALLRDVMREDVENRAEAALLLAEIAEKAKDWKQAREAYEIVAKDAKDAMEAAFAGLKLAAFHERDAIERDRAALAAYDQIVARQPAGPVSEAVAARAKALRSRIEAAEKALDRLKVTLVDADP